MKVAVVIRAHKTTRKLEHLIRSLSGSDRYDLYLAANETRNQVSDFGIVKLAHTAEIMAPLGARFADEVNLVHASDMVFSFLRERLPEHDFILLVEDDVHFTIDARGYVERVVERVRSRPTGIDLVVTKLRRAEHDWWWFQEGRRLFADPWAMLFSIVGLSTRAITALRAGRQREVEGDRQDGLVFCEAFVPSLLREQGDFTMVDFNEMISASYRDDMFTIGLPFLLEDPDWAARGFAMAHPVFSAPQFLERRFSHAMAPGGNVQAFLVDLENRQAAFEPLLRLEYAARAGAAISMEIANRLARLEARMLQ